MGTDESKTGSGVEADVRAGLVNRIPLGVSAVFLEPSGRLVAMKEDEIAVLTMLFLFDRSLGIQPLLVNLFLGNEVDKIVEVGFNAAARVGEDLIEGLLVGRGPKVVELWKALDQLVRRIFQVGMSVDIEELGTTVELARAGRGGGSGRGVGGEKRGQRRKERQRKQDEQGGWQAERGVERAGRRRLVSARGHDKNLAIRRSLRQGG